MGVLPIGGVASCLSCNQRAGLVNCFFLKMIFELILQSSHRKYAELTESDKEAVQMGEYVLLVQGNVGKEASEEPAEDGAENRAAGKFKLILRQDAVPNQCHTSSSAQSIFNLRIKNHFGDYKIIEDSFKEIY